MAKVNQRQKEYYEALVKYGAVEVKMVKCVITGPPEAGKSSLKKRLQKQKLPKTYYSTGIATSPDVVITKKITQQSVSLNSQKWQARSVQELSRSLIASASDHVHSILEESIPQANTALESISQTEYIISPVINETSNAIHVEVDEDDSIYSEEGLSSDEEQQDTPDLQKAFKRLNIIANGHYSKAGLEKAPFVHIIDTGGQPELHELLPAFITGPAINIIVFRMDKGLDQRYDIRYRNRDLSVTNVCNSYQSSITHESMIFRSLASIACLGNKKDMKMFPHIGSSCSFVVGTHRDKVSNADALAINRKITQSIKSGNVFVENIVMHYTTTEAVYMVDNTVNECNVINALRKRIDQEVHDKFEPILVPVVWLSLYVELKNILKQDTKVISTEICFNIAKTCGIKSEKDMCKALDFLHYIGSIMYFPELENIVIIDVQVIFDCITELITSCFFFDITRNPATEDHFGRGIFFMDDLRKVINEKNFHLDSKQIVYILLHLSAIAEVTKEGDSIRQFFMPCALKPTYIESNVCSPDDRPVPLLVCFKCGYCPVGVFTSLIAYLMTKASSEHFKWELDFSVPQFRNKLQFKVGPCKDSVTFISQATYYEIWVDREIEGIDVLPLPDVCNQVRSNIHEGIKVVTKSLNYTYNTEHYFGYYCTCTVSSPHPAVCEYYDPQYCVVATCSRDKSHNITLNSDHKVWIGKQSYQRKGEGNSLDISDLNDVVHSVKEIVNWMELGLELGICYTTLQKIEEEQRGRVERCKREMLAAWLQGVDQAKEQSWSTLMNALKAIEKVTLSQAI